MVETLIKPDNEAYPDRKHVFSVAGADNTHSPQESELYFNRKRITRTMRNLPAANGLLEERCELIDGIIILKMPVNPPRRIALILLRDWLIALFGSVFIQTENPLALPGDEGEITEPKPDSVFIQTENPLALPGDEGEITEPKPDIVVTLAPTTDYVESNPGPQDARLVVEISDSTLNYDLTTKALLYARVGIPEYWVMDINGRRLRRHRQPAQDGYRDIVILSETENVSPLNRIETALIHDLLPALRPAPAQ